MKRVTVRFLLVSGGLFLGIAASEVSLRVSGLAYRYWRSCGAFPGDAASQVILCLGDSYTFGVGAPKGWSYPDRLQVLLDAKCGKGAFRVVNEGVPGHNSSQSAARLPALLSSEKTSRVLILSGINNVTLALSNYHDFEGAGNLRSRARLYFSGWRLSKVLRRFVYSKAAPVPAERPFAPCGRATVGILEKGRERMEMSDFREAERLFRMALTREPGCGEAHFSSAMALYRSGEYTAAFACGRSALQLEPGHPSVEWLMSKELPLTRGEEAAPVLDRLLYHELSVMGNICRVYDATPVMLSYPVGEGRRDRLRAEAAGRSVGLFLDLKPAVKKACPASGGANPCFSYDLPGGGHPNALGYEAMAAAVFSGLNDAGLLACSR